MSIECWDGDCKMCPVRIKCAEDLYSDKKRKRKVGKIFAEHVDKIVFKLIKEEIK